jgi:DNA helicase HerA-like ATPase
MSIRVGEVIAVNGVKITLKIDDDSNKETLYFDGDKYKGVSIREYLSIQRGFRNIICIVEGEYLDESRIETDGARVGYIRKVDARPIGYFDNEEFKHGIKFMPMIKDAAFLLTEERIAAIFGRNNAEGFTVGRMLKEDIPISLPWQKLFNSHIGIFGNTGSGKSNTLAKLYTVLFEEKAAGISGKSRFVILDFNGEYTGEQLTKASAKKVYKLSTQNVGGDKFPLHKDEFWNSETLSLLFQATQNTQKPFLIRMVEGRRRFENQQDSLTNYTKAIFRRAFCAAKPKADTLDLMRNIARIIENDVLANLLRDLSWHSRQERFFRPRDATYFEADGLQYDATLAPTINLIDLARLDAFDQLVVRAYLQLISDLIYGFVQFEHIQPLLKRVESSLNSLRKVLTVGDQQAESKLVTVISLKRCNNETRKLLPLLIAKHFYNEHKYTVVQPPNKTIHLIVDEAHNILSQQSAREHESWKDYRLELFEEIVKEGRKFGVFITISSQRPADISPTIVSQLHNFFIHRLVNDRDLFLIDNTITTLDNLSRGLIPNLAQGCCVVTGTAFDLPMVLQIDPLDRAKQPDSEDVNLLELWADPVVEKSS